MQKRHTIFEGEDLESYFFSFITQKKVSKPVLFGESENNQPFSNQAKGLFYF